MGFWSKLRGADQDGSDAVFVGLRSEVLHLKPETLGIDVDDSSPVYGIAMETGLRGGSATFVCLKDGTVSMYTSTGGGLIGAGSHEPVRRACLDLVSWMNQYAQELIGACEHAVDFPLPGRGLVFFYLLTTSGVYLARCKEAKLAAQEDPFSNLFVACHAVLTEAREATERHQAG